MRGLIFATAAIAWLGMTASLRAERVKEPSYASQKPLYAYLALGEEITKVLTMVFHESAGTGKGYDRIYADVNLNGDLTDDKPVEGDVTKEEGSSECWFPAIVVREGEKEKGVEKVWELSVSYSEFRPTRFFGLLRAEPSRSFEMSVEIVAKDGGGEWKCSFDSELNPAERTETTLVTPLLGKPEIVVSVRQDREKEGNILIVSYLTSRAGGIECTKGGEALPARVDITDRQGKVVHSEEVSLDKLGVAEEVKGGYSVHVPAGRHRLEISVDTGPIAGVVKAAKTFVMD